MQKIKDQLKTIIRASLNRLGGRRSKIVVDDETSCYEIGASGAAYAPWRADPVFLNKTIYAGRQIPAL